MARGVSRLLADFQGCYDDLVRFLTRRLGDGGQALDVAQDTFIRLAASPDPGLEVRNGRAYVFRVAGNIAVDHRRRDRRRGMMEGAEEEGLGVPDTAPSAETRLTDRRSLAALDAAMAELPPKARHALLLSRVEGLSHAEIAARLGVSESMIAKYLAQALKHCRTRLSQQGIREFK